MSTPTVSSTTTPKPVSFKQVALPAEHGSWSLVIEPILLGMFVAPSWGGLLLAVAGFALFLLQRPLTVVWSDWRRGRRYARTRVAGRYALLYGGVALLAGLAAVLVAGWRPLWPAVAALPLVAVFLFYSRRPGRTWQAELAAPAAFSAIATAIALADGWAAAPALALWAAMAARSVPAILFVRARLRLDKDKPAQPVAVIAVHGLAVLALLPLVWAGLLPWTTVLAMVILLGRAVWLLAPWRWRLTVKQLGFLETGFGLLTVVLIAAGYWA